jgi:cytidine deaminase
MHQKHIEFTFQVYNDINELSESDAKLVEKASHNTALAYAPYSQFRVSAPALLSNGEIVTGTNQENASYPVSICAERSLLVSAAALVPEAYITTMAITYDTNRNNSLQPISPCGMCRQAIIEHQSRYGHTMRLILVSKWGEIIVVENATSLLALAFSNKAM